MHPLFFNRNNVINRGGTAGINSMSINPQFNVSEMTTQALNEDHFMVYFCMGY